MDVYKITSFRALLQLDLFWSSVTLYGHLWVYRTRLGDGHASECYIHVFIKLKQLLNLCTLLKQICENYIESAIMPFFEELNLNIIQKCLDMYMYNQYRD